MTRRLRRYRLLAWVVGACLVGIPIGSVVYKLSIWFYGFKDMATRKIRPKWPSPMQALQLPPTEGKSLGIAGSLFLFSDWSPEVVRIDESFGSERLRFHPTPSQSVDVTLEPLAGLPDLVLTEMALYQMAKTAWGDWDAFVRQYPRDRDALEAVFDKELPPYLSLSSPAMQTRIGYYALPLFPAPRNYQKEYALLGMKVILLPESKMVRKTSGENLYFLFYTGHPNSREGLATVLFGEISTGKLLGWVLVKNAENLTVDEQLIGQLCYCLDHSPLLRNWPRRAAREKSMVHWRDELSPEWR